MTLADPFGWLARCAESTTRLPIWKPAPMADTLLADCRVLLDGARELADELLALAQHPDCPAQVPARAAYATATPWKRCSRSFAAHGLPALVSRGAGI